MNQAHYHLLLNHLPIIGTLIGILTLGTGFLLKSSHVKRTALVIFVFAAVCAIPAFLTGEGAEEVVEEMPGVTETVIEQHEDLAAIFIWVTSALGIVALLTLISDLRAMSLNKLLYGLTAALCIATMVLAQQVGTTGGKIRHTEIRTSADQPATPEPDDD
ncbi:MAG: hypothetical protein ABL895_20590 [Cyclobacteriaceae bacterium]